MFEGSAMLHNANKRMPVTVVVLSDILFFLTENNAKYYFVTPDNQRSSVVPVQTLLVREKSGPNTKSLYLISTCEGPEPPETYEMDIQQPPTREDWIAGIREAVDAFTSPDDLEVDLDAAAEARRFVEAKYMRVRHLIADMRGKDVAVARLLEEQMRTMGDMCVVLGASNPLRDNPPDYVSLAREKDASCTKEDLLERLNEAMRYTHIIANGGPTSLSRSASSASGDKKASHELPKRSDTFGGFDVSLSLLPLEEQCQRHQQAVVGLNHNLNEVTCLINEHFTSLESLRSEVAEIREKNSVSGGRYKQNQELEELRYLQVKKFHFRRKTSFAVF